MAIVRWSPFQELDSIERRMRRAFEESGFAPTLVPAADVYETEDEFVVELDVPGYDEKELEIEVSDHMLVVKGEQGETKKKIDKTFKLHERLEREFERRFSLPTEVDTEHVTATFDKGVLKVHTPKSTTLKPRKISIAKA